MRTLSFNCSRTQILLSRFTNQENYFCRQQISVLRFRENNGENNGESFGLSFVFDLSLCSYFDFEHFTFVLILYQVPLSLQCNGNRVLVKTVGKNLEYLYVYKYIKNIFYLLCNYCCDYNYSIIFNMS